MPNAYTAAIVATIIVLLVAAIAAYFALTAEGGALNKDYLFVLGPDGKCLAPAGDRMVMETCDPEKESHRFLKVPLDEGGYNLKSAASGYCLDAAKNGGRGYMKDECDTSYQQWLYTDGKALKQVATQRCLDAAMRDGAIASDPYASGDCNAGNPNQVWTLKKIKGE